MERESEALALEWQPFLVMKDEGRLSLLSSQSDSDLGPEGVLEQQSPDRIGNTTA